MFHKIKKVHFVGIGGIGMSGIAEVLLNLGFQVSGSDLKRGQQTVRLEGMGAKIYYGHRAGNLHDADVVVTSSAVRPDNAEVVEAKRTFVPVIQRAEMLAELMRMKFSIAVAGAHGKTTTSSLVSAILGQAGFDPTSVIGGRVNNLGTNAKLGSGKYLVAEADESDGTFLLLFPTIAIATNVDLEHLDFYSTIDEIKSAFQSFLNKVPFFGLVILCIDNPNLQSLIPLLKRRCLTYGLSKQADLRAEAIRHNGFSSRFNVVYQDQELGQIHLAVPGVHNVVNALAAIGVGLELDIPFSTMQEALEGFGGVHRRLELRHNGEIKVLDDYGHHPTEIKATLAAVRSMWQGRIIVAFQPHRYSRTRGLLEEFTTSFNEADVLIITDIYAASEEPIEGITAEMLAERIRMSGHKQVLYISSKKEVMDRIVQMAQPGDMIVTLGAGDIVRLSDALAALWSGQGGTA